MGYIASLSNIDKTAPSFTRKIKDATFKSIDILYLYGKFAITAKILY